MPRSPGRFQSTPPARGATKQVCRKSACVGISIHAPREGGDFFLTLAEFTLIISIHAPREGGDLLKGKKAVKENYFNPRPPRGGRLGEHHGIQALRRISIHAPREGGDLPVAWPTPLRFRIFQSTPPARGATQLRHKLQSMHIISIHAPREGGDGMYQHIVDSFQISIHAPARGATART